MPTDSSILLQGQPIQDPLAQYGRVLALKNAIGQGQVQQQQIQEGQQTLNGQRALDQAYQQAFTKDADGNTTLNKDAVIQGLTSRGAGHLVPGVLKGFQEMDTTAADLKKKQAEAKTASDDYTANSLLTIADSKYDPSIAIGTIAHAREAGAISPQQAVQLADQITANPTPQTVQAIIEPLLSKSPAYQKLVDSRKTAAASTLNAETNKAAEARAATTSAAKLPGEQAASAQAVRSDAAARLGAAKDQAEYQAILGKLPFEVAKEFDGKTPEQARKLGMTAEQQTQAAQAATNESDTKDYRNREMSLRQSELSLSKSKDAREQKIYDQTYGEGANPALVGVPPAQRGQAIGAAQKAADEYVKAQAAQRDMQTFIDLAKSGNKEAHAYLSPEGVLTLNTARGVTRVNRQEIDAFAGAGSLFDQIAGKVGKLTSGQSVPPEVIRDIETLQKQIAGNSGTTYNQKLNGINQNYRANFKPIAEVPPQSVDTGGWKVIGVK